MSAAAGYGFMIWDGESVGTLLNVVRLLRQDKKVVVYLASKKRFVDLRNLDDWDSFVVDCSADLRARVEHEAALEVADVELLDPAPSAQRTMF